MWKNSLKIIVWNSTINIVLDKIDSKNEITIYWLLTNNFSYLFLTDWIY